LLKSQSEELTNEKLMELEFKSLQKSVYSLIMRDPKILIAKCLVVEQTYARFDEMSLDITSFAKA